MHVGGQAAAKTPRRLLDLDICTERNNASEGTTLDRSIAGN
jgi:hypothetical protein